MSGRGFAYAELVRHQAPLSHWPLGGGPRQLVDLGVNGRDLSESGTVGEGGAPGVLSEPFADFDGNPANGLLTSPAAELDLAPFPCVDVWFVLDSLGVNILTLSFGTVEAWVLFTNGTDLLWRTNNAGGLLTVPGVLDAGRLYHACAWYDGTVLSVDLNGRSYSTAYAGGAVDQSDSFVAVGFGYSFGLDGAVGQLAAWNRPPTAAERLARLKAGMRGLGSLR